MSEAWEVRAGRYIRQSTGYRAFLPAPLPPDPPVRLDDQLQILLSAADQALGRLDGAIATLPDPDLFVFMYVRKEAVFSSQIEGTQSSLVDVLEAEAEIFHPERPRDVREVINYIRAMSLGLSRLTELPVSIRLVREMHRELLTGVRGAERNPGELRTSQNWIGPGGCTLADALFVPPPPDSVGQALSDWEKYLHSNHPTPALIQIGLAHAQFETIHPFLDGNGRIGRLLITFLLCERGLLHKPVLYLSHYFRRHRSLYYEKLQSIRERGDWEGWLEFYLGGVAEIAAEATLTSRRVLRLREDHRRLIVERFGRTAAGGMRLLEHLYKRPIVSIQHLDGVTGSTYQVNNRLVQKFVEQGLLVEISGHSRNRVFSYEPYLRLFADDTEPAGAGIE